MNPLIAAARFAEALEKARKPADEYRKARRRFERRAKQLAKEAAKERGITKERLTKAQQANLKKAAELYRDVSHRDRFIERVKKETGLNLKPLFRNEVTEKRAINLWAESSAILAKKLRDHRENRDALARDLLQDDELARRIYGSTVEIWSKHVKPGGKIDTDAINETLMKAFDADDMLEVIMKFEDQFSNLYSPATVDNFDYDDIKVRAQKWIRSLGLVDETETE